MVSQGHPKRLVSTMACHPSPAADPRQVRACPRAHQPLASRQQQTKPPTPAWCVSRDLHPHASVVGMLSIALGETIPCPNDDVSLAQRPTGRRDNGSGGALSRSPCRNGQKCFVQRGSTLEPRGETIDRIQQDRQHKKVASLSQDPWPAPALSVAHHDSPAIETCTEPEMAAKHAESRAPQQWKA